MSERFVEWGVGSDGLMSPEFGGGWLEKAAVDEYLSETPQHIVLKCPFTGATSRLHTQGQVDAHERVVAWHVAALTAEREALNAELQSVKNGNGWWEVTPAGQKRRCSVNEEEELRVACDEITALAAERTANRRLHEQSQECVAQLESNIAFLNQRVETEAAENARLKAPVSGEEARAVIEDGLPGSATFRIAACGFADAIIAARSNPPAPPLD